jgi:hypothetical protein
MFSFSVLSHPTTYRLRPHKRISFLSFSQKREKKMSRLEPRQNQEIAWSWPCSTFFRQNSFAENFFLASGFALFKNRSIVTDQDIAILEYSQARLLGRTYKGDTWYTSSILASFFSELQEWVPNKQFMFTLHFLFLPRMVSSQEHNNKGKKEAEEQSQSKKRFLQSEGKKTRDIAKCRYYCVPIHDEDHWVMVVIDFPNKKLLWFDSQNSKATYTRFENSLRNTLLKFVKMVEGRFVHTEWSSVFLNKELDIRISDEGYLCGPFVCLVAYWFAANVVKKQKQENWSAFKLLVENKINRFAAYLLLLFKKLQRHMPFEPFRVEEKA